MDTNTKISGLGRYSYKDELLLVFPPISDALFFPYLSLPYLTSYLKKYNRSVKQFDMNLELSRQLLSKPSLYNIINDYIKDDNINSIFTKRFIDNYLRNYNIHNSILNSSSLSKKYKNIEKDFSVTYIKNMLNIILKDSIIKENHNNINKIVDIAQSEIKNDFVAKKMFEILKTQILQSKPKIIGFSVPFFSQLLPTLIMCRFVKENFPHVKIILGGPQIYLWNRQLIKHDNFPEIVDYLGTGDGEETLLQLIKFLNNEISSIDKVPNLIIAKSQKQSAATHFVKINDLPTPDFKGLNLDSYIIEKPQLALTTCIGCYWGKCAFCSYGNKSKYQNNYQQKSYKNIANQCINLYEKYNINHINFVDENTNLKLVLKAMETLKDAGYSFTYSTRNRMEKSLLSLEYCYKLRASGCTQMSIGYETNSQRILDLMNKGVKSDDYQTIIDNLFDNGIEMRFSVMTNFPGETKEEHENSIAFLVKNRDKIEIDIVQTLSIENKSFISEDPKKFGVKEFLEESKQVNLDGIMGRHGIHANFYNNNLKQQDYGAKFNKQSKKIIEEVRYELYPWIDFISDFSEHEILLFDFLNLKAFKLPSFYKTIFQKLPINYNKNSSETFSNDLTLLLEKNIIFPVKNDRY